MEKKLNPIYPNSQFKTFCYIKSVITRPNIIVGDYSYYDDSEDGPESFEKHVTYHYDFMGDKLIIGKSVARRLENCGDPIFSKVAATYRKWEAEIARGLAKNEFGWTFTNAKMEAANDVA